jgi:hypothetical protein
MESGMYSQLLTEFEGSRRKVILGGGALAIIVVTAIGYFASRKVHVPPVASVAQVRVESNSGIGGFYSTKFAAAENPIREGQNWINGETAGVDWANVRTVPGLAYGTQTGTIEFNDAVALLTGTWGPNQTVQATVHSVKQNDTIFEEVELRLRSSVSLHHATGYEIMFRCSKTPGAYTAIARWNGALGDFTSLNNVKGAQYGVADGDVVKATIVGNVITAYINGVQVLQATDSTYTNGNPGVGFCLFNQKKWLRRNFFRFVKGEGENSDYGFTSFSATDGAPLDQFGIR